MDQAMNPLKPYLKDLAKLISPILTGINEFTANVGKIKSEYQKIIQEYNKTKALQDKLTNYVMYMKASFIKLLIKQVTERKFIATKLKFIIFS